VGNSQGAFVISGGTRTTLPDLSSYGGGGFSGATRINNHRIAEAPGTDSGYSRAVLWSNGTITDLAALGGTQSAAYASTTTARSSPAAPMPGAKNTRSCSHPASDRVQDLSPARLIRAGRNGRLRRTGTVHTIQRNEQTQEEDRHEILAATRTGNGCLRCDDACSAGHRDLFGVRQLKLAARRRIQHQSPRLLHPQRGTNDLAIDLNGTWSTPINIGASGLPAGVSVAGTPVVPQPDPQDYTLDAEGYVALAVPSGHQAMQPHQPAVNTTPAIAPRARSRR